MQYLFRRSPNFFKYIVHLELSEILIDTRAVFSSDNGVLVEVILAGLGRQYLVNWHLFFDCHVFYLDDLVTSIRVIEEFEKLNGENVKVTLVL